MTRVFAWSLASLALGVIVAANEKPTMEFQSLMRSNAAAVGMNGLRGHVPSKDYDAVAKDAATLKDNFTKLEAFWTQKKVDDAVSFAKKAHEAAEDLESAAKAKDDAKIAAANMTLTAQCAACHMAHRERLPDMTFEIK
jgi:mono/diheme cytochrome c family protein